MGHNDKPKDDEVYGKGNFQDYGFRMLDNRINRFISVDPLTKSYPWYTPYEFAGNTPIEAIDLDGLEEYHTKDGNLIGKYGNNTEIRIVYDNYIKEATLLFQLPANTPTSNAINNLIYNDKSAGTFRSPDAAANDWAERYNPVAIQNNQESISFIFSITINSKRVTSYTEPVPGGEATVKAYWDGGGPNTRYYGTIHSHGAYVPKYDNNEFSTVNGDIEGSDKKGTTDYISTPNGSLKRYNTVLGVQTLNESIPSDPKDPDRKNNIPPESRATKDVSSE